MTDLHNAIMNTIDLLEKALCRHSAAAWARQMNIDPSTFAQAKRRGRLSPTIAGMIAVEMGEDAQAWIAQAALEAEPDGPLLEKLRACNWRKRFLTSPLHLVSLAQAAMARFCYPVHSTLDA